MDPSGTLVTLSGDDTARPMCKTHLIVDWGHVMVSWMLQLQ